MTPGFSRQTGDCCKHRMKVSEDENEEERNCLLKARSIGAMTDEMERGSEGC